MQRRVLALWACFHGPWPLLLCRSARRGPQSAQDPVERTVITKDGSMYRGDVLEYVISSHITLKLSSGESKRIAWDEIDQVSPRKPKRPLLPCRQAQRHRRAAQVRRRARPIGKPAAEQRSHHRAHRLPQRRRSPLDAARRIRNGTHRHHPRQHHLSRRSDGIRSRQPPGAQAWRWKPSPHHLERSQADLPPVEKAIRPMSARRNEQWCYATVKPCAVTWSNRSRACTRRFDFGSGETRRLFVERHPAHHRTACARVSSPIPPTGELLVHLDTGSRLLARTLNTSPSSS